MGNLLGAPKKNPRATITDHDRAVLTLKAQRKKLDDRCKVLEKRIEQDTIVARTLIAQKKKDTALLALKRRKLSENQLASIQDYLLNVEGMLTDMELTKQQTSVMAALKQGNDALKKAQQEMPLDDIQSLMDETAEAKDYQDKVQQVLAQQLDAGDNEAVLSELQQLEEAALAEEMAAMPSVPATDPQQQQQQQIGGAQTAAAAAGPAGAAAAAEEELPSVPKTKVDAAAAPSAREEGEKQLEEPMLAS